MKSTRANRILSIVLSLLIVIGITAISRETVLADTDTTSGLTYTITDGKATITDFTAPTGFDGTVAVPDTLGGASVTSIGSWSFYGCTSLTSITFPSSVTSIGGGAFENCTSLTSITIPSSVTIIGVAAFDSCFSLMSVTVDAANTAYKSIDGILYSKDGTKLICCPAGKSGSITIPNSVTSIGAGAFAECTSLTSITIPSSVTSIGSYAFGGCSSLTSITIPSSVTRIVAYAFYGCSELTDAYFYGNAPTMGVEVFGACAPTFTVHYLSGKTGYTNPWEGYPTAVWNGVYQDETKTREFVTRFYQLCLGREPDAGGLTHWVDSLLSGSLTGANAAYNFVFSTEFLNRNVTDNEYLSIMYHAFFNRDPDAGGAAYWQAYLDNGMSRYWILSNFVNSEEFRNICNTYGISVGSLAITAPVDKYPQITQFVTRFYKLCLDRMPDAAGLDHWVVQLQTQNLAGANVAHDIVTSEEFTNRGTTNDEFVEIMYKAFFDRASEASGKAYWTGRLAAGTSRYTVLSGFVNSQEFTNICSTYGINRGSM